MPVNAFRFSKFSSLTFGCLGCTLAHAEEAARSIAEQHGFSFQIGHYTLEEIFYESAGRAHRRSAASSTTALLFPAPIELKTLVVSNSSDGWVTLCNAIALRLKTYVYAFSLSGEDDPDARNALEYRDYSSPQVKGRVVYVMKDPQWVFYEEGEPLYFEDVANYKKRSVKDRLNKQILLAYCGRLGLNVEDPDFFHPQDSLLRIQHSW